MRLTLALMLALLAGGVMADDECDPCYVSATTACSDDDDSSVDSDEADEPFVESRYDSATFNTRGAEPTHIDSPTFDGTYASDDFFSQDWRL